MALYFDRAGNAFQIDDEKVLTRRKTITVTNEKGEEFEIAAAKADEHKLTPDERQTIAKRLHAQVANLSKTLGFCPVIDPIFDFGHGFCPVYEPPPDPGCPMIDPIMIANVKGSLAARGATQISPEMITVLRTILDCCPQIDPPRLGTILGSLIRRTDQYRAEIRGCPQIDPPDIGSIAGTYTYPAYRRMSPEVFGLLRGLLDSCPAIDPPRLGSILGSLVQKEMNLGH